MRPRFDTDPSPPSNAVVKKEYSYTSTPPMGRTATTVPQCLYKGALHLYFFTFLIVPVSGCHLCEISVLKTIFIKKFKFGILYILNSILFSDVEVYFFLFSRLIFV